MNNLLSYIVGNSEGNINVDATLDRIKDVLEAASSVHDGHVREIAPVVVKVFAEHQFVSYKNLLAMVTDALHAQQTQLSDSEINTTLSVYISNPEMFHMSRGPGRGISLKSTFTAMQHEKAVAASTPKRRGRKPGSKNRPKVQAQAPSQTQAEPQEEAPTEVEGSETEVQ